MLQNKNHLKSHEKIQTDCMNQMNHIKESLVKVNESRGGHVEKLDHVKNFNK